ncbi:MAG: hypothetical protein HY040_05325 [Planctomycetes bacterium]|nr:hypothetical protein [Planctomycetota bacterium]
MLKLLKWIAAGLLYPLGFFFLIGMIILLIERTPMFLDPKFAGFWHDVEAYHLDLDDKKTLGELTREYGNYAVTYYVLEPGHTMVYLPSEQAAFMNLLSHMISEKARKGKSFASEAGFGLLTFMSVAMVLRLLQRAVSWLACRSQAAQNMRRRYFDTIAKHRLRWVAAVFAMTLIFCWLLAESMMSVPLERKGMTVIDLTFALVVLAYFGGFWTYLVVQLIDSLFLMFAVDPHRSCWDQLLAILIMAPILSLVYQNSWTTILATAFTALASDLLMKWSLMRRERSPMPDDNAKAQLAFEPE